MNYKKLVVVFDDIITTGRSLVQARDMLRERGAVTVAAYFIGRTVRTGVF